MKGKVQTHFFRRSLILISVFHLLVLFNSSAFSQTIKGTFPFLKTPEQIGELISILKKNDLSEVPKFFYGKDNIYDDKLADLIFFIDKTSNTDNTEKKTSEDVSKNIALLKGCKSIDELFGEKFIYIMLFVTESTDNSRSARDKIDAETTEETTEKLTTYSPDSVSKPNAGTVTENIKKTVNKMKEPFSVAQSSLDWRQGSGEFVLYSALKTIVSIFSGGPSIEKVDKSQTITEVKADIHLSEVGCCEKTRLLFGYLRVALAENTINRFTIQDELEKVRYIATFGNYSGSRVTSSISLLGSGHRPYVSNNEKDKRIIVDGFICANYYILRPQMPSPRYPKDASRAFLKTASLSLVLGTKISKNLFDDVFVGISAGHLISTFGITLGINFRTITKTYDDGTKSTWRKPCFSAGICIIM